jgi:hypothetical protein
MKEIMLAFVHVFAMMAPWLVFGFLMAGIIAVWISAQLGEPHDGRKLWLPRHSPRRRDRRRGPFAFRRPLGVCRVLGDNDGLQYGATGGDGPSQVLFKVVRPRGAKVPLRVKEMIQYQSNAR